MTEKELLEKIDMQFLLQTARQAGEAIMEVYQQKELFDRVDYKADDSPLTLADQRAHEIIKEKLEKAYPEIPLISEEGKDIPYKERKEWLAFWLVDPLDGTKEFIKRNGEFTVNIALIYDKAPVLGVIYIPEAGLFYYGSKAMGAFKQNRDSEAEAIRVSGKSDDITAVRSRSHTSEEEMEVLHSLHAKHFVATGSSIKFCLVADGTADLYYRHGPTMEWDTAAGQAILEAAGGQVLSGAQPMRYNKENMLNTPFICRGFDSHADFEH
jgi:3'(2'), 5'-bisphosphate nucleotidase